MNDTDASGNESTPMYPAAYPAEQHASLCVVQHSDGRPCSFYTYDAPKEALHDPTR